MDNKNIIITGRDEALDMMKCIGILSVIVGHFGHDLQPVICSFHMPLFFIISGYFFNDKRTVKESVTKDVNHLLVPYFVSCSIVLLYWLIIGFKNEDYSEFSRYLQGIFWTTSSHTAAFFRDTPWAGAMWFFMALFWCKNIYLRLSLIPIGSKNKLTLLISVISIIAILTFHRLICLPFAFLQGLSALIFYDFGHRIKMAGGFTALNKEIVYALILLRVTIVLWNYFRLGGPNMDMWSCTYYHLPIDIVGACGGTLFIYRVSSEMVNIPYHFKRFINWIGRNSLAFLCIHSIDLKISFCKGQFESSLAKIFAEVVLCCLVTYFLGKIPLMKKTFNIYSGE